jgi:PEGA domain
MMDRRCFRALAPGGLLVALFLVAPVAGAAPVSDDDATTQRVADLYKRGNALYDEKKWIEAEPLYLEAWRLKKTYDVACNLGALELDLGKPREAAGYFAFALREFPAGGKAATHETLKVRLALARAEVGTLHVRVNVAGAEVSVGDRLVGKAPIEDELFVSPGAVRVSASAPGYEQTFQSVQVTKGGSVDVVLTMKELRRNVVPGAVLGGLAGAALVTGVVLEAVAASKHATNSSLNRAIIEAQNSCVAGASNFDPRCSTLQSSSSTVDTLGRAGVGAFVGAGALAAGSLVYFLWPKSKTPAPASGGIRVVPTVSTTGGGIFLSGAF